MRAELVGSITSIRRYPVKSMGGEVLRAATVAEGRGVDGDRRHAILDVETGRIASAKHPRRWGGLLECQARVVDPGEDGRADGAAVITLPGGATLRTDAVDVDAALSAALGRSLRLVDAPPAQAVYDEVAPGSEAIQRVPLSVGAGVGTLFDFAPIHILTTATLDRLAELAPASRIAVERFRPNLVIDTGDARGFVENEWVGRVIAIGESVRLCVTFPCPRCVMSTLPQGPLPGDPEVLRAAATHNRQFFALLARKVPALGVYATVLRGGAIGIGDEVRLEGRAPLARATAVLRAARRAVRRR